MSRICVKNLPAYVSKDRLREHFSLKGEITDIKLIHTQDGKSRQVGYVGYRTDQEAGEALKYFDKSFMDTCRISCEIAHKVGDPKISRPWSRYSLEKHEILSKRKISMGSEGSKGAQAHGGTSRAKKKDVLNDNPEFQEFLQVMQSRKKSKLWANDSLAFTSLDSKHDPAKDTLTVEAKVDGYTEEFSTEYEKEEILKIGRLDIFNLPYVATEEETEKHFSRFGDITHFHLVIDKETKQSKGKAFVVYSLPESAVRAFEELNKTSFQGRILYIRPAKENNIFKTNNFTQHYSSKTFKQLRNEERKASETNGDRRGWNSLFMRTDTVVENIARKLGVSKTELLDGEANDLAVRTSLGETKVIEDTKRALSDAGIDVALLEVSCGKNNNALKKSRVILVKNLPYCSSESELAEMFGKFGNLEKVVLPSTHTLALVIFVETVDAHACFNALRYKCYKGAPLYLELVPECILNKTTLIPGGDSSNNSVMVDRDSNRVLLNQQVKEDMTDFDVDHDKIESRSVYIKNLNFRTSDDELKKHFTDRMTEGIIFSVTIKKRIKDGKIVSMGFGFIEFDSVDTALKIYKDMQGTVLDQHALTLQLCQAKKDELNGHKKFGRVKGSKKLIVKNVAFESTEKDLRQLFSSFGQRLRLPKRFGDGNHRGFAFVEYVTVKEAADALQALSNTHLYGRHLVIEIAKEGESLEELQARTARQFAQDPLNPSKTRKNSTLLDNNGN
ncbi:unnamed protein product [Cuscuta epithymum]|uniref:RRM domain-containing protein n=1 Tax=Cuscuta epithymum TaxID=186058 RepID=A0AAV0FS78_9ASTE|nr:unnamed protein product [Cuscuta epithymum]